MELSVRPVSDRSSSSGFWSLAQANENEIRFAFVSTYFQSLLWPLLLLICTVLLSNVNLRLILLLSGVLLLLHRLVARARLASLLVLPSLLRLPSLLGLAPLR